jgi:hypothetical protein
LRPGGGVSVVFVGHKNWGLGPVFPESNKGEFVGQFAKMQNLASKTLDLDGFRIATCNKTEIEIPKLSHINHSKKSEKHLCEEWISLER